MVMAVLLLLFEITCLQSDKWIDFLVRVKRNNKRWGREAVMHSIQPHGIDPIVPLTLKRKSLPYSHALTDWLIRTLAEMLPNSWLICVMRNLWLILPIVLVSWLNPNDMLYFRYDVIAQTSWRNMTQYVWRATLNSISARHFLATLRYLCHLLIWWWHHLWTAPHVDTVGILYLRQNWILSKKGRTVIWIWIYTGRRWRLLWNRRSVRMGMLSDIWIKSRGEEEDYHCEECTWPIFTSSNTRNPINVRRE